MPRQKKRPAQQKKRKPSASIFSKMKTGTLVLVFLIPVVLIGVGGVTAAQFENHDSFCGSCHTEPESEYLQRDSGAQPVDLASFHAEKKDARCIDCHSGKGVIGRVSAMMLGGRDLLAFVTHNYKQPAPLTRPITDEHCLKCHAAVTQRQDFNNHFHVFLSQWQARDPSAAGCVDCHQSHTTDGQASLAFLNQQTTSQVCQRCHNFAGAGG
jgi:predicted CXXCH cytochrome family protein